MSWNIALTSRHTVRESVSIQPMNYVLESRKQIVFHMYTVPLTPILSNPKAMGFASGGGAGQVCWSWASPVLLVRSTSVRFPTSPRVMGVARIANGRNRNDSRKQIMVPLLKDCQWTSK